VELEFNRQASQSSSSRSLPKKISSSRSEAKKKKKTCNTTSDDDDDESTGSSTETDVACYALLRMRPLSFACAEDFRVTTDGEGEYEKFQMVQQVTQEAALLSSV
jgi:hypothetical protein